MLRLALEKHTIQDDSNKWQISNKYIELACYSLVILMALALHPLVYRIWRGGVGAPMVRCARHTGLRFMRYPIYVVCVLCL